MKVIGITGGIATGKSTITKRLKDLGYKIIDCDEIAHQVADKLEVIKKVRVTFGDHAIVNGKLNRKVLGEIIFNNPIFQEKLNDIIHPLVIKEVKRQLKLINEDIVFVDVPLLYEAKMESLMDKVIVVYIPEEIQLQRLIKRDQIDDSYAYKKIRSQMPISIKAKLADYLINNENNVNDTLKQLDEILRRIKSEV